MRQITSLADLEARYDAPREASLRKEIDHVNAPYRAFVEAAPMVIVATSGPDGLDCSPKGDVPGFVRVIDERTVAIPDRPGNNRLDGLRNLVENPRIALLFIIPGVSETLRINGTARISIDPDLLASFEVGGKQPRTVLLVDIAAVYFHCSRAFVRSKLWDPASQVPRAFLPSAGDMLECITTGDIDGAEYDRNLPTRVAATLY